MLSKLIYGYVLLNVIFLVQGTLPMTGTSALLNWVIIVALSVFLYRRSPNLRRIVADLRARHTVANRRAQPTPVTEPAVFN